MIQLKPVTKENWLECISLKLHSTQEGFVSSNLYSLAQAKFEPCRVPCAIYNQAGEMVGFTMYNDSPLDDGTYRLSRLMIDAQHQGHGYGRAAAQAVIERLRQLPDCDEMWLDFVPENDGAARLWQNLGFVVLGREGKNLLAKLVFE